MNKLLQYQILKHFGQADKIPESFTELLNVISESYNHYEEDCKVKELSIEQSSKEMTELNSQVKKNGKDELEKAHKQLKTLLEDINQVLYSIDMVSYKLTEMSAVCEKVYGYTATEFLADGDLWQKVIHPEDKHIAEQHIQSLAWDKQVVNQYRIIHKDESIRWIENKIIPAFDETGRLIRIDGVTSDISERKQAEQELERSFSMLEATIESTADGILVADFNGKIVRFNKKFVELWKIPRAILDLQDVKSATAFVLDQLMDPEEFVSKVKELYIHQKDISFDIIKFKDGRIFERYSQPQLINGNCAGRVWSFRDITEEKNAEEALRESEKRLRQIIDLVPHFIFAKDAKGKFILANEAVAAAYGSTVEDLIGKSDADFNLKKDEVEHFNLEDLKVINSGNARYNIEETMTDATGNIRVLSTTKIPYTSQGVDTPGVLGVCVDISERKTAETILKENADQLAIAAQIAKLGYWEFDVLKGLFTFNDQFYSIYKTTAEKAGGYTMSAERYAVLFVHPDDIPIIAMAARDAIKSPDPRYSRQLEYRIIYENGGIGHMAVRFFIVKDNQGRTIKTFGANQDITERKKAEEALFNNELRFRTLTGSAPVGIFQTDIKGKNTYVNETWLEYTGMSFEEAMGDGWTAAIYPGDREIILNEWSDKSEKGIQSSIEYRLIDKKGNIRWVMGNAVPISNKSGEVFGHIGTVSDITERKLAIVSLQQSEIKYRQIVETAQEGIWVIDENNYTVFVNKKLCEMLGYQEDEIIGRQNYFFKDDEEKIRAGEQIERRKKGFKESHDSSYITKSGNTVWGHVSSNPIYNEDGSYKGALAMITDITQRKQHEELLRRSEANLELNNKELELRNKELEQFAYVASHDLQEPLRTTSSFAELLQRQYKGKLDEKADQYLSFMTQSADRMKVLIKDLLDYSRIGKKREWNAVDCNVTLREVLADLDTAIKETSAEITVDHLPIVNGYSTEIKQLFQNLVMNAIKFRKGKTSPRVTISAHNNGNFWEFACKDNGIGIEEQHKERVFIIFQRLHTRNEYEGSGIGLAHCKKIVELHGGKIWIESKPGEGTTFHFTIRNNTNG